MSGSICTRSGSICRAWLRTCVNVSLDGVLFAGGPAISISEAWRERAADTRCVSGRSATACTGTRPPLSASTIGEIIEIAASRGHRAEPWVDDKRSEAAMPESKKEGYFPTCIVPTGGRHVPTVATQASCAGYQGIVATLGLPLRPVWPCRLSRTHDKSRPDGGTCGWFVNGTCAFTRRQAVSTTAEHSHRPPAIRQQVDL